MMKAWVRTDPVGRQCSGYLRQIRLLKQTNKHVNRSNKPHSESGDTMETVPLPALSSGVTSQVVSHVQTSACLAEVLATR